MLIYQIDFGKNFSKEETYQIQVLKNKDDINKLILNKEDELLLLSSTININEFRAKFKALLQQNLNWSYILEKVEYQGLSGILYKHISSLEIDSSFQSEKIIEIRKNLLTQHEAFLGKNIIFQNELKQILSEFNKEKIEIIIMKGMYLVEHIYKNPALRPMVDIDILVKRSDIEKSHNCLEKCGFKLKLADYLVDFTKFPADVQYYKQYHQLNILLEMHWHLFIPSSIRGKAFSKTDDLISTVWQTAEKGQILGEKVKIMSATILVLFLCMHLCQHYIIDGIWICDLYETINLFFEDIKWELLVDYSKNYKIEKLIYFPMLKVYKMFKTFDDWRGEISNSQKHSEQPEELIEQRKKRKEILNEINKVLNAITPTTMEKFFYEKFIINIKSEFLKAKLTDFLLINSNWERLKAVLKYLLPSKAYCEERYRKKLTFSQYISYIIFRKIK